MKMPASHQAPEAYFESRIGFLWDVIIRPDFKETMVKLFDSNPTRPEDSFLQGCQSFQRLSFSAGLGFEIAMS